jgi:hypothetical protein
MDGMHKQERIHARHTTDPHYFYWNNKANRVRARYEETRNLIMDAFGKVKYERVVFLDSNADNAIDVLEGVRVIGCKTDPHFFDCLDNRIWGWLSKTKEQPN